MSALLHNLNATPLRSKKGWAGPPLPLSLSLSLLAATMKAAEGWLASVNVLLLSAEPAAAAHLRLLLLL